MLWGHFRKATLKEDGVELYHLGIGEVISSISKDQEGGQIAESCQYCYALWVERGTDDEEGKRPPNVIVGQGCWSSPDGCRSDGSCIQTARRHEGPLLKLNLANVTTQHRPLSACCCRGAMCNENFTSESKRIDELATYLTSRRTSLFVYNLPTLHIMCFICRRKTNFKGRSSNGHGHSHTHSGAFGHHRAHNSALENM